MSAAPLPHDRTPLVVDVDGTLIKSDLLLEAALQFVATQPWRCWRLLVWLFAGKAALKAHLAAAVAVPTETIPLRPETLAAMDQARAAGQPVWLASASDRRWVEQIAARVGGIDGVLGSDGHTNLAGGRKAAALVARFGEGGFDYAGDQPVDLPVWAAARGQLVVAHDAALERRVRDRFPHATVIARPRRPFALHLRALRPHQWAKNLLVFLPILAGHSLTNVHAIAAAIAAFVAFCCAASGAYVINDLLDLPGDRDHQRKRNRPFASGDLPIIAGLFMAPLLLGGAGLLAAVLTPRFAAVLAGYVVLTLAYSLVLKRKVLIDIIVLGGLYTIRVLGGVAATSEPQSQWLLMFSLFLFLSLAAVKRCSELVARREAGKPPPLGRGYRLDDLQVLFPLASAAGYLAVLVVALYLYSPDVTRLYHHPTRMWLVCPLLLYWISRVLLKSNRDEMHDDPVIFALTDRVSWATGLALAFVVAVSI